MPAPSTTWIRTRGGDPPDAAERGAEKDGGHPRGVARGRGAAVTSPGHTGWTAQPDPDPTPWQDRRPPSLSTRPVRPDGEDLTGQRVAIQVRSRDELISDPEAVRRIRLARSPSPDRLIDDAELLRVLAQDGGVTPEELIVDGVDTSLRDLTLIDVYATGPTRTVPGQDELFLPCTPETVWWARTFDPRVPVQTWVMPVSRVRVEVQLPEPPPVAFGEELDTRTPQQRMVARARALTDWPERDPVSAQTAYPITGRRAIFARPDFAELWQVGRVLSEVGWFYGQDLIVLTCTEEDWWRWQLRKEFPASCPVPTFAVWVY